MNHTTLLPVLFFCVLLSSCATKDKPKMTEELVAELKASNSYLVHGFVIQQGKYSLKDSPPLTATEAILRTGGFAAFCDIKHVIFRRGTGRMSQRIIINMDRIMRKGAKDEVNPIMRAGDVITVNEKSITF
jgi:hypothetical protein